MKDILPELENKLKSYLQKNVVFSIDGKTIKSGKLIIFSHSYYSLVFTLKNKNKNITYKIPVPFDFESLSDKIVLSYKINKFTKNNKEIEDILSKISNKNYSKLYNKNLELLDAKQRV